MEHTTTSGAKVREDGHSEGCRGFGIVGFEVERGHVTRYHYCVIPVRAHRPITTTKES